MATRKRSDVTSSRSRGWSTTHAESFGTSQAAGGSFKSVESTGTSHTESFSPLTPQEARTFRRLLMEDILRNLRKGKTS